jgi:hypothetical protein
MARNTARHRAVGRQTGFSFGAQTPRPANPIPLSDFADPPPADVMLHYPTGESLEVTWRQISIDPHCKHWVVEVPPDARLTDGMIISVDGSYMGVETVERNMTRRLSPIN